jgi:hypothetical protein
VQISSLVIACALVMSSASPKAAAIGPGARQEQSVNVAGTWRLSVETAQGTGTPSVTFEQNGEKLTGTYSSQVFGEQPVTGSIKGPAITFAFTASVEATSITVTYTGTVENDAMKGKVTLGDLGEGTFSGRKEK